MSHLEGVPLEMEVPSCHAVRVSYPGYIEHMDAAIETLGGPQGLSRAAALGNVRLPLSFRPGDSLCRPVVGEKCAARGLLLRVPKAALETGCTVSAQILAKVTSSYQFAALADFQFVADSSLPAFLPKKGAPGSTLEAVRGSDPQPLLTIPPSFVRNEDAIIYRFRSFYGDDHPSLRGQGAGNTKGQLPPHVRKFSALKIPEPAKPTDFVMAHYSVARWHILTELRKLFAERAVWTPLALQERIPGCKSTIDPDLLAKVAYVFRSGPFLSLWIRRGYDPRQDRASCKYQATVYILPANWAASLKHSTAARPDDLEAGAEADEARAALPAVSQVYSELCRFAAVPKQNAVLQLCDVQDLHVSSMASQTSHLLKTCHKHTGWYDAAAWEKMEKRIQSRFQALLSKYTQGNDGNPEGPDGEGNIPAELETAASQGDRPAEAIAAVPEAEPVRADGEGGIFPEAMLENLDAAWSKTAAGGRDTDQSTTPAENVEAAAVEGPGGDQVLGGQAEGEDFLIFEASSSGSEAEGGQEQEDGEEDDEEEEEDNLDDSDDDEEEEEEEEAESSGEEEHDG